MRERLQRRHMRAALQTTLRMILRTTRTAGPGFEPGALALLPGCGFQVFIVLILRDALRGIKPPAKTAQRRRWAPSAGDYSLLFGPKFERSGH